MIYVLVHSPLVGPSTWAPVAEEIRAWGMQAVVPDLHSGQTEELPYWKGHALAVAEDIAPLPEDEPLALVAHSGAGLLLPAVREEIEHPVAAYLFVDAGIPEDGKSRLDLLHSEMPEVAEEMHQTLLAGGRAPNWTDESLKKALADEAKRRTVLMELYPQSLAYYTEPIPVPAWWPDAPCAYLQFSPVYDSHAERARRDGWPVLKMDGGHFHMLMDPAEVATAIVALVKRIMVHPA